MCRAGPVGTGLAQGCCMPAHPTTTGRGSQRRFLLAALALGACIEVHDASDEAAKKAAADSAGGAVYIGDAKPNAATPSPDTYGPDSATPVRGFGPAAI